MDKLSRPLGRYSETFVWLSLLEVFQEVGQEGGYWNLLRVLDQRLGGQGHT